MNKLYPYDIVGAPGFKGSSFKNSDRYIFVNDINIYEARGIINSTFIDDRIELKIVMNGEDMYDDDILGSKISPTYLFVTDYQNPNPNTNITFEFKVQLIEREIECDTMGTNVWTVKYLILSERNVKNFKHEDCESINKKLARIRKIDKLLS